MGYMLGSSCNSCCADQDQGPCPCLEGQLPDTVTVTLSGPQGTKEQGPPLLLLRFAGCFGSGGGGVAIAPGGVPEEDIGPISDATVTDGGSGYAKLGRVAPTLTITGGSGEGATFTPTLESTNDDCGVPTWEIASVAASGGSGYQDNDSLTVSAAEGDTTVREASITLNTVRAQPEVTATVSGGEGAVLSVALATDDSEDWYVDSVTVVEGGSGYAEAAAVTFEAAERDVVVFEATAVVRTNRIEPSVSAEVFSSGGSGAVLEVTLTQSGDVWTVSAIAVINGGSNYSNGDIVYSMTSDEELDSLFGLAVVTNGAITSVTIDRGGEFYRGGGIIESIELTFGGIYYRESAGSVTVQNGGKYYREDPAEQPYVASVSVSVLQGWPGKLGSGATLTATVDSDTASETFGQIASVAVTNGGSDYLGWRWIYSCDCDWIYGEEPPQDHTVVAWRDLRFFRTFEGSPCLYYSPRCYASEDSVTSDSWVRTGPFALIRAVVTSDLVPFATASIEGPEGKPGRDNGPIVAVGDVVREPWIDPRKRRGYAYPGRVQDQPSIIGGTEVSVTATMSQQFNSNVLPYWSVVSVTVPSGVEGFTNNQVVDLESTTQEPLIDIPEQERPGEEDDRQKALGRAVVDEDGFLVGLTILSGGKFYNESADESVIAPAVSAEVQQYLPSQGSGAEIEATINTDLDDEDFGTLSLSIANAGDGYLGGYTGADFVIVTYPGPNSPPTVGSNRNASPIGTLGGCVTTLTAAEPITDCDDFSFEATFGDQTATVSPGGEVAPPFEGSNKCCHRCFVCCPEMPSQVVATFTREANEGYSLRVEDNPLGLFWTFGSIELTQDAYYTTCPEHEVEVVWDVEDLHAANRCSVDFCDELPEEEECFSDAVIDANTRLWIDSTGTIVPIDDPSGVDYGLPTPERVYITGDVLWSVGLVGFTIPGGPGIAFISNDFNEDPHPCGAAVLAASAWIGNGTSGGGGLPSAATVRRYYSKANELKCDTVPGEWDASEERQYSVNLGAAAGLAAELGLPAELEGEPDDPYFIRSTEVGETLLLARFDGIARRICNNYEVTVDFQ
jgi:hypothetical protein